MKVFVSALSGLFTSALMSVLTSAVISVLRRLISIPTIRIRTSMCT